MTKATQRILRKIAIFGMGIAGLVMLFATLYKWMKGVETDYFGNILSISLIFMMFFSALTRGSKDEGDQFMENDELGQLIIAKSAKIGYYLLLAVMTLILAIEHLVYKQRMNRQQGEPLPRPIPLPEGCMNHPAPLNHETC